jgi:hypothetical protein
MEDLKAYIKKRIKKIDSTHQKSPSISLLASPARPYLLKAVRDGNQGKSAVHVVEF